MTNTTEPKTQLEQNLLKAARALGAHQIDELRAIKNKNHSAVLLEEAEFELAEADVVYSAAKISLHTSTRRQQSLKDENQAKSQNTEQTRQHLWTVSSSPDDAVIIAAAHQYGEAVRDYWTHRQEREQSFRTHARAQEALKVAAEAHQAAELKRSQAKAEAEHYAALALKLSVLGNALEGSVTDAANALTDTLEMRCAYSYVNTADLPIVLPEDASPKADG